MYWFKFKCQKLEVKKCVSKWQRDTLQILNQSPSCYKWHLKSPPPPQITHRGLRVRPLPQTSVTLGKTGGGDRWRGRKAKKGRGKKGSKRGKRGLIYRVRKKSNVLHFGCSGEENPAALYLKAPVMELLLIFYVTSCARHTQTHAKCNKHTNRSEDNPLYITSVLLLTDTGSVWVTCECLCVWLCVSDSRV